MIREDYIIRLIRQSVQILAYAIKLTKRQFYDEALEHIDRTLAELLGYNLSYITRLTPNELMGQVITGEPTHLVRPKAALVAALLDETAIVYDALGRAEESANASAKALDLLLVLWLQDPHTPFPEFTPRIQDLVDRLHDFSLPPRTYVALMDYYEQIGEYAKAEDTFCTLREALPASSNLRQLGIAFYQRLQKHSDAELIDGNLPRDEIEQALDSLLTERGKAPSARS